MILNIAIYLDSCIDLRGRTQLFALHGTLNPIRIKLVERRYNKKGN
jgi:hypothetical protein